MVLLWSALVHAFNFYAILSIFSWPVYKEVPRHTPRTEFIVVTLAQSLALLFYPLAGLLAEMVWTRFKVMVADTVLMFTGLLVFIPVLALIYRGYVCFLGEYQEPKKCVQSLLRESQHQRVYLGCLFISLFLFKSGIALFVANVIQFGVDQLQFSPSKGLSNFVHWYYWTSVFLSWATGPSRPEFFGIQLLYVPLIQLLLILVTFVLLCFRRHLNTEPVGHTNPLRLIYKVLNFARKHTRPIYRSAFTYGEPFPSRLDLAKNRYGGPFSTEEVEDVKSFWRILAVLFSLFGFTILHDSRLAFLATHSWSSMVLGVFGPTGTGYSSLVIVIGVPLFQVIGWPYPSDMLKRMGLGLVFGLLYFASVVLLKLFAPSNLPRDLLLNNLFAIPLLLGGFANLLVFPTALEFILAQAPRSMQGLLIGLWYAYQSQGVVSELVGMVATSVWNSYWIDLSKFLLVAVFLPVYAFVAHKYKHRWRDEPSIVNQKVIIEEYTDRQLIYEYSCRKSSEEFGDLMEKPKTCSKKDYDTLHSEVQS